MRLFGRKKEQQANSTSTDADSKMFSSQAAAALAAAAASSSTSKAAGPAPTGRQLLGSDITIDLDSLKPPEAVPELQVQPITLLKFDYKLEHTQQVAINSDYICYGLKAGHIRALNRNTASRALFKGHLTSLSCMAFFNADTSLLASCSRDGNVTVRKVSDGPSADGEMVPTQTLMLVGQLPMPGTADDEHLLEVLAWHPSTPQILAAAAADAVYIFEVPVTPPAQVLPPVAPGIKYSLPVPGAAVTGVAFSPAGDLLVACDSTGHVHAWWLEGDEDMDAPVLSWQPFGRATSSSTGTSGVASVRFLHQASDNSSLLLTGDASNSSLKLWALPAAGSSTAGRARAQPVCLQSVTFTSDQGPKDFFCHVVVQPELQLVVVANTVRKQVYTLHYDLDAEEEGSAATSAALARLDYAAFFSVKQPILSLAPALDTVESQVVPGELQPQQLLLYCVQTEGIQQYMVNPALCSIVDDTTEEIIEMLDEGGFYAAADTAAAETDVEEGEEVSSAAPPVPAAAVAPSAAAAEAAAEAQLLAVPEESVAELAPAAAAEEAQEVVPAAVPPPAQLPTPGRLLQVSASHSADSEQSAENSMPAAVASTAAAAATAAAVAADSRTKEQLEAAVISAAEAPAAAAAAPLPPMPTTSLMQSAEQLASDEDSATAAAEAAPAAAVNGPAVPPAAVSAAAGHPVAAADFSALQQQMQQLLAMQQELAAQLQSSSQQTVAGVKAELGRALKSSEASLSKQVETSIKASAKKSEEERRKAAGKDRQELEKLITQQLDKVSANLQRDLSKLMADTAREQARSAVTATVNAVTPAVAAAVASSMQRELAGGSQLQAALERSLASSLARPLHDALRENFAASLIPAFERATQVMFGQVEAAFTNWLAESSRTVSSSQAEATSALTGAVSQLQGVVTSMRTELADTSRSLSRMASNAASRVAHGDSTAGSTLSVSQLEAGARAAAAPVVQDPRVEIGAVLAARKYEEALVKALNTASLDVLMWTCKQVDPALVLGGSSVGLSQTTLLSLVHQLSANLSNDANTPLKLAWLAEAAPVVDPHDPVTAPHLKGVLTGVMSSLKGLVNSLPQSDAMAKKGKITLHLFNSLLHQ